MEFENVLKVDKEVYNALIAEKGRQQNCLELIASENFTSLAVMEAMRSEDIILTNMQKVILGTDIMLDVNL